ncbi:hypothetical protein [Thermosipho sp. 1244]|uniref:hypothetical protein n=1 Tax=Thermosipho sp. 1244 TaxID=1755816 RepID=UPI001BDF4499|nr:hypothetical protein [Thermosipho sp. 1244]MBT1248688.1 hypothetical protein [Thermosipho sp. 1244]
MVHYEFDFKPLKLRAISKKLSDYVEKLKNRNNMTRYEKLLYIFRNFGLKYLVKNIPKSQYSIILKILKNEKELYEKILDFIKEKKEFFHDILNKEFQNSLLVDRELFQLIKLFYKDLSKIYTKEPEKRLMHLIKSSKSPKGIFEYYKKVESRVFINFVSITNSAYINFSEEGTIENLLKLLDEIRFYFPYYKDLIYEIFERHVMFFKDNFDHRFLNKLLELNFLKFNTISELEKILLSLGFSKEVIEIIRVYFLKEHIEQFFVSDNERIVFWKQYIKKIRDIKIEKYYNTEAIIMYFDKYDIVEFKDVGNAAYVYPKGVVDTLFDLKNKYKCIGRLLHQGFWQETFEKQLERLGL